MAQIDLEGLKTLHDSANYLLDHCPQARESLRFKGKQKWIEQVSEASLTMLEACNLSKDIMTLVKHSLQDLQSTLRCNESNLNEKITSYNQFRNKLKKETQNCLNCLKRMKSKGKVLEENLLFVSEVLREVRKWIVSMVKSLFSLVCIPWLEKRQIKGSFSSIFGMQVYCFDDVWDEISVQSGSTSLEAAQIAVEEFEIELGCIFKRLIQTRVSLLNILRPSPYRWWLS